MHRLLRTTSFRFTVIYVLLFAVAVAALAAFVYRATFGEASKQTDALIEREVDALTQLYQQSGPGVLTTVIRSRTAWRDDSIYMLIGAPSGAVLAGNLTALPPEALSTARGFFTFEFERGVVDAAGNEQGVELREARGKIVRLRNNSGGNNSYLIVVGRDVTEREGLRARSQGVMQWIALGVIGFGVVIGVVFSQSLLRRVDAVNKTASAIREGDLSQRIALNGSGDELDHLGENLNAMLDQIERLMSGMREVSDNIAHDLRSPLTRVRGRLSNALDDPSADREEVLRATVKDTDSMLSTFNALLAIARIESGEGAGVLQELDVAEIAKELGELYEPAAQDAGFELSVHCEPVPNILGSRALISQALSNFLDNALKYARGGTRIEIHVRTAQNGVNLSVLDDGPGVDKKDRGRILGRFVRLEESRSSPGSGLGLSLVAAIARAHSARLGLGNGLPHLTNGAADPSAPLDDEPIEGDGEAQPIGAQNDQGAEPQIAENPQGFDGPTSPESAPRGCGLRIGITFPAA